MAVCRWQSYRWLSVLGLTLSLGIVEAGIVCQVAQAYTDAVNVTLDRGLNESFQSLASRAETTARATAQQSFDRDILVTAVKVTVLAANGEVVVPLLVMEVSRENWRSRPDPQYWSTYYNSARELLELDSSTTTGEIAP